MNKRVRDRGRERKERKSRIERKQKARGKIKEHKRQKSQSEEIKLQGKCLLYEIKYPSWDYHSLTIPHSTLLNAGLCTILFAFFRTRVTFVKRK